MDLPDSLFSELKAVAEKSLHYFQVCNAMDRTNFPVANGVPPGPPPELVLQVALEEVLGELEARGYIRSCVVEKKND